MFSNIVRVPSISQEFSPPVIDTEANRYINKTAFDEPVAETLRTFIYWGCPKTATQSYLEFLPGNPKLEKLNELERIKLSETDCSTYDVSFMVLLIPKVCRDVAKQGTLPWTEVNDTRVEWLITKLKNFRNNDIHEPEGDAVSHTTLDPIKELVRNLLNVAGKNYGVEPMKIKETIDRIIQTIDEIALHVMSEKEKRMIKLKEDVCNGCAKEIEETAKHQETEKLPFSDVVLRRSKIFHRSRCSVVKYQGGIPGTNSIKSCEGLLNELTNDSIIIITGQPGSGKSTLSKTVREDFVLTKPEIFPGLKDYSLLLYMECGIASLRTIPQLLRHNFPKTLRNIDDETAVEVFKSLKLLIVVDGVDESTECSKLLLNELLEYFSKHGDASFIFTSRPGAVQILESNLRSKRLTYLTASIKPLTEENEQIEYLERYQKHVQEFNAPGLIEAFKRLDDPCKNCLILPVYLSLFCHLFSSSPRVVAKWTNELGIMEQSQEVSKDFIRKRLRNEDIKDEGEQNELATKLMAALCDLSVGQVLKGITTFDQKTYSRLCLDVFGDRYVNRYTIMSCVLIGHSHQSYFQYVHKTQAEFLAACAIRKRLESDPNLSVLGAISKVNAEFRIRMQDGRNRDAGEDDDDDAQLSTEEACKFENAFKFLIMMFWEVRSEKPDLFQRRLREVCQTLTDGGTPFSYWAELYLSCNSPEVAEVAAESAKAVVTKKDADPWWYVDNPRFMRAAIVMLQLQQPPRLELKVEKPEHGFYPLGNASTTLENASNTLVNVSSTLKNASTTLKDAPTTQENASTILETLMKRVAESFKGMFTLNLWHSYRSFTPVDKLLTILTNSNCKLCYFAGCLEGDSAAWQALRDCLSWQRGGDFGPSLFISLLHPHHHQLDHLHNTSHILVLDVKMTTSDGGQKSCRLPLSKKQPPILTVVCSSDEEDQGAKVAALFIDLAPEDKKYSHVIVQHCKATDEELNTLVNKLSDAGLRTVEKGVSPKWHRTSTDRDGSCRTCGDIDHRPKERCVQIDLPKPYLRIDANRLIVATEMDMTLVTEHLPRTFFPWLVVETKRAQPVPFALEPLMKAIGKYHKGTLDLNFLHSDRDCVPVDDLLTHLDSAQSPLVYFRGCLSGNCEQAWRALTECVLKAEQEELPQTLAITLLEPRQHMLHLLDGSQHRIELRTRLPMETSVQGHRPLPEMSNRPAVLIIDCSPTEGAGQPGDDETRAARVAALIKDLAPGNMKHYYRLDLQNWPGSNEALDELMADLAAAGVSSPANESSVWTPSFRYDGRCSTCQESSVHAQGLRCVQLEVHPIEEEREWCSGSDSE